MTFLVNIGKPQKIRLLQQKNRSPAAIKKPPITSLDLTGRCFNPAAI